MSSLTSLLVAAALAAAAQPTPHPAKPSSTTATLTIIAEDQALVGIVYGIDRVDGQPRYHGRQISANIPAGERTVWYSCPNAPQMGTGSHTTFDFVAGHRYSLVCRAGIGVVISQSDEC